ncbi:alpha-tocopherol transfer protein-like isoform X1 [Maniola hyperantus]|uniref:alpha-tocopherol transfer protein-like isoform X1 n=2 Tax=Aphantopus hyperantus TaxID=2795564 RepID=UPI00156A3FA9|nr:alpha-tocopherol transfer protein-like isoform X1 [Maniola hyperantus]
MMYLESHPFYPCTEAEKLAIRKEVGIKDGIFQEDIDAILDWFYKEPHLADAVIDRDYVEKMLISTRCSREKCKRKIDNFYRYRSYAPELIQTRIEQLSDPDFDPWSFYRQAAIPKLFNGKRISVFQLTDPNPSNLHCEVALRNTIMLGDLRLKYDYMLGDIWIMDLLNATIGHVLRVNLALMQKFTHIVQDGIGWKLYEVHIVNASSFSQHFVNLFKPFVKPKIMERVRFHGNVEELHEFIPKQYLPKDFGGDQPSLDEFKELYRTEIQKPLSKDYLIKCCQQVSNEQKRNSDAYNEDFIMGSFKKLDID